VKRPRTKKDLLNDPRVDEIWKEDWEGEDLSDQGVFAKSWWWVSLAEGYICDATGTHTIHEPTLKDVCDLMGAVIKEEGEA